MSKTYINAAHVTSDTSTGWASFGGLDARALVQTLVSRGGYDWRDHNRMLRDGILGRCPRVGLPVVSTLAVWVTEMDLTSPTDEQGDLK
jgi:hypothetical protein